MVHRDVPFTFEPLGIAIAPGDTELANWLGSFLALLKGAAGRLDSRGDYLVPGPLMAQKATLNAPESITGGIGCWA